MLSRSPLRRILINFGRTAFALTALSLPCSASADSVRMTAWRFYQSVGTDGTPFCGLDSRLERGGQVEKSIQIRSFSGKPHLNVDFTDVGWAMPDRSQFTVLFDAASLHPVSMLATAYPRVLDL